MSQYIEFYVRKGETYLPVGTYCRVDTRYQVFNSLVTAYGGLTPITSEILKEAQDEVNCELDDKKKALKRIERERANILKANNSLEEKVAYLSDYDETEADYKEEIELWTAAYYFIDSLRGILDEARYDETDGIIKDKYLYAGIEVEIKKDENEITEEDRKRMVY